MATKLVRQVGESKSTGAMQKTNMSDRGICISRPWSASALACRSPIESPRKKVLSSWT